MIFSPLTASRLATSYYGDKSKRVVKCEKLDEKVMATCHLKKFIDIASGSALRLRHTAQPSPYIIGGGKNMRTRHVRTLLSLYYPS